MARTELERVLNWADGKLAAGAEPPWAWYQYMKLRETLQAILAGIQAASPERRVHRNRNHLRRAVFD